MSYEIVKKNILQPTPISKGNASISFRFFESKGYSKSLGIDRELGW